MPLKLLLHNTNNIPDDVREGIVQLLLSDGSESGFIPAELAAFRDGEKINASAFGMKIKSKAGKVPEEFEETGIPALLEIRLQSKYIPMGTELPS